MYPTRPPSTPEGVGWFQRGTMRSYNLILNFKTKNVSNAVMSTEIFVVFGKSENNKAKGYE